MFRVKPAVDVMDPQSGGGRRSLSQWTTEELSATAIFAIFKKDCECNVISSNFSFQAICKVQRQNRVHELCAASGCDQASGNVFL